MTREEFSALPLASKWDHIQVVMDYIVGMDRQYDTTTNLYQVRRRYNPHHPTNDMAKEDKAFKEQQRNLRIDQYQRWAHLKDLYAEHRDELCNTLDNERYAECKNILERIFTMEVDDALKEITEQ